MLLGRKTISSLYVGYVVSSVFLFATLLAVLFPITDKTEESNAAPIPSETTLSMTTPSVSLNLAIDNADGTFIASDPYDFTVTTNNYTGYTLNISAKVDDENSTKLVNGNYALDSIEAATADGTGFSVGDWGYKPSKIDSADNTDFLPAPTYEGSIINATSSANSTADAYSLAIAAKADYTTITGTYSNTFVLTAVPNLVNYTITYDKNTTDTVTNMPTAQTGTLSSSDITISATLPTRSGYKFLGWCDGATTTSFDEDICNGIEYDPGDIYATTMQGINVLSLRAMWALIPAAGTFDRAYFDAEKSKVPGTNYYAMQDMTADICAAAVGTGALIDTRDNHVYRVIKISAGKRCWLQDNLALDIVNTSLSSLKNKTNASDLTLEYLKGVRTGTTSDQYPIAGIANWTTGSVVPNRPLQYMNNKNDEKIAGRKTGGFYNGCAISAGSYCPESSSSVFSTKEEDICPTGWRIPERTEFTQIGNTSSIVGNLLLSPTGMILSVENGTMENPTYGSWFLFVTKQVTFRSTSSSGAFVVPGYPASRGYTVRCIAKDS